MNLLLELAIVVAVLTGLASWALADRWAQALTLAHALAGLMLVVLARPKQRGPVATGLRRRRASRWLSLELAVAVTATVVLGVLHATGLWFGVGPWTALWTHVLLAAVVVPLLVWHVVSRPVRPRATDLDRRLLVRATVVAGVAGAALGAQEVARRALGGADRRSTGSHEVASHDPGALPPVIWLDDDIPADADEPDAWRITIAGRTTTVAALRSAARPVDAVLDCTGGWWSEQTWAVVPLADLLPDERGRSLRVTSRTGYRRRFPRSDADRLHLAVGYEGQDLRPVHGGPVRLVVPGRRGPWWVKWVDEVALDDRPWWLQLPLPIS